MERTQGLNTAVRWVAVFLLCVITATAWTATLWVSPQAAGASGPGPGDCDDSFDELDDRLWESAQRPRLGSIAAMPEVAFEQGRLRIRTQVGAYSSGGLGSRFLLRGDFDVKVDARMDFLPGLKGMDQVLMFVVEDDRSRATAYIGAARKEDGRPFVFAWHWKPGDRISKPRSEPASDAFEAILRIVREGDRITAFYGDQGSGSQKELMTFTGLDGDVAVGLSAKNMIGRQEEVNATAAVTAEFDDFRVNRVDEIVWKPGPEQTFDATTGCDQAPHYLWKGKLAQDEGEALELFLKATALCPGFIRPYELAGDLYRKQGRTEEAVACFEKAGELGSVNYKLYYQLARLLFEQGGMDDASRHLDRSLRIRPDYPPAIELKREMERVVDGEGPTIVLYEPAARRGVTLIHVQENLTVRGLVTDQSGVAWVEVNGERTALDDYGHFLRDVPILTGENTILVDAEDTRGNRKRLSVSVRGEFHPLSKLSKVDAPAQAAGLYGRSYAVVIGVDRYEKWPPLEFAASDATAVKEALERSGFDDITLILNEEATQRRILTELFETLPRKADVNDRVVFYFAGHGQTEDLPEDGKRGYIIPVDAGMSDYPATAVSMDQIRTLSSRIRAKHIFYVMDSCYSGLGFNRSAGVSPQISDYLRKISAMRVVQVITAGGKGEQVQEQGGHGLFTAFFLKALEGEADLDKDNVVTGTELGAYLRPAVSNASNQAQTPLYGRLEGEGEFLFFVQRPGDGG